MNTTNNTSKLVILGLMTGILLLMAYTPLGYLNIGPLAITFNVIPVAIAAITLGPAGGAAIGAVFGMTSFLQCIGIGGSELRWESMLFSINPCSGICAEIRSAYAGWSSVRIHLSQCNVRRRTDAYMASLHNRILFRVSKYGVLYDRLWCVLFGNTEYMQGLIGGKNIILFVCGFVGINAVCEMVSSTIITGAVGAALYRAKFVPTLEKSRG